MLGAVVGAFWSGFLADRFGRKPIVVGTMLVLFLGHGALVFYAAHSKIYAIALFFIIGCSSGGYIVVNLVLMIESLEKSRSRLLVVSLNGWPLGMSFAALVGYLTLSWRSYHMVMSITAAVLLLILVRPMGFLYKFFSNYFPWKVFAGWSIMTDCIRRIKSKWRSTTGISYPRLDPAHISQFKPRISRRCECFDLRSSFLGSTST